MISIIIINFVMTIKFINFFYFTIYNNFINLIHFIMINQFLNLNYFFDILFINFNHLIRLIKLNLNYQIEIFTNFLNLIMNFIIITMKGYFILNFSVNIQFFKVFDNLNVFFLNLSYH